MSIQHICFVGFGEVGSTLAAALMSKPLTFTSLDTAFSDPNSKASEYAKNFPNLNVSTQADERVRAADLVISAVTAEQATAAADSVLSYLKSDAWYWDINSVAPNTKQSMADLLGRDVRFVEGAIMSPIQPKGIGSPILIGGPYAREFTNIITNLGFSGSEYFADEIGNAAASKMCRSVIIIGMESLLTESLISARYYGVENQVLDSLSNLLPGVDWQQHSAYMVSRSLEHGVRRAEEMREVHKTVKDAGLLGLMSAACAETQAWTADFKQHVVADTLIPMLDQFREQL